MDYTRKQPIFLIVLMILIGMGIVIFFVGYGMSSEYNKPKISNSEMNSSGLVMTWSNRVNGTVGTITLPSINDVNLGLYFDPVNDEIDITVSFNWFSSENHTFYVIIPTYIEKDYSEQKNFVLLGNISDLNIQNVTGQQSAILSFTFTPNSARDNYVPESYFIELHAVGNIANDERGQLEFYLPIGQFPKGNASIALFDVAHIPWLSVSDYNVTATVAIASNEPIQSVYPPTAVLTEPSVHPDAKWLTWTWTTPTNSATPVAVNYVNNTEVDKYQNDLFLGGIFMGVGASLGFASFVDVLRLKIMDWNSKGNEEDSESPDMDTNAGIEKIIYEDLKGTATDDDIRFIIQNRIDIRKFVFGDYLALGLSLVAIFISLLAVNSIKGINPLDILFAAILVMVFCVLLILAPNRFRSESNRLLREYIKLRQSASKKETKASEKPEIDSSDKTAQNLESKSN